ncbi:MAG: type IIL restriction-modification enzyme MmeI, partial [Microcoleus sp.]|uniref:type IIL restriction-modification enzyme MmeI n=1 Tax=Microcoleus sp. TaxID=44472 RepID=UPI003C71652D
LILDVLESEKAINQFNVDSSCIRPFLGSQEFIRGIERRCVWLSESDYSKATENEWLKERFECVKQQRSESRRATTKQLAAVPFRFGEVRQTGTEIITIIPKVSSETREYLPVGLLNSGSIVSDLAFALYDAPLWNMALIASRLHLVWIATVCGKLETRYRYSNTLGWNTFPVPTLTDRNKTDLTRCAEDILLAREAHFPATIAELYAPDKMPENLRQAHDRNDEILERIYIGRRFKNDTERLEKLFELYTQMTTPQALPKKPAKGKIHP